jgi:isopropylmalate/homocitrate/citramalate synthase
MMSFNHKYNGLLKNTIGVLERDNYIINKMLNIRLFDVTLRDGLQGLTYDEQKKFTTDKKKELYDFIIKKHNPYNIEVGSCVNNKIFPVFNDINEIFDFAEKKKNDNYVLVPNLNKLFNAIDLGVKNFSFITSVSNSFQVKNTKMTLSQNYDELFKMLNYLKNDDILKSNYNIKLYVSCINECPIEGKIDNYNIITELFSLFGLGFHKICLSDTCGTLNKNDFEIIIKGIKQIGLDISNFSLHLHANKNNENETEKVFHCALDYGIKEFDVSELTSGGCSMTMDKSKMTANLNYEQIYRFLIKYYENEYYKYCTK